MIWYGHDMGGGLIALLLGLLTAVIVIAVILRVVDRSGRDLVRRRPGPDEILAERYARGELTDEEYRHRLSVLHSDDHVVR